MPATSFFFPFPDYSIAHKIVIKFLSYLLGLLEIFQNLVYSVLITPYTGRKWFGKGVEEQEEELYKWLNTVPVPGELASGPF